MVVAFHVQWMQTTAQAVQCRCRLKANLVTEFTFPFKSGPLIPRSTAFRSVSGGRRKHSRNHVRDEKLLAEKWTLNYHDRMLARRKGQCRAQGHSEDAPTGDSEGTENNKSNVELDRKSPETINEADTFGGINEADAFAGLDGDDVGTAAVTAAAVGQDPISAAQAAAREAGNHLSGESAWLGDSVSPISPALAEIYASCQTYTWKGFKINYAVQGSGPPILLVHGFGASIGHWRKNIPVLSRSHTVYAIDLLGQGGSQKPASYVYTIEGWAELIGDFLRDVVREPAVLVGNSIGSLAVLLASAEAAEGTIAGTVLLNCAGGMNNKAASDDLRIRLALPLFWLIDWLLLRPAVARGLFNRVRSRSNVKTVLQSVYSNKDAVDDELVEVIIKPADDEGALDAFVAIITGPPGPRPELLVPRVSNPMLLLWGDEDPFTPFDGPIGRFFRKLPESRPDVEFVELPKIGHCPHDDDPELVHSALLPWLGKVHAPATAIAK